MKSDRNIYQNESNCTFFRIFSKEHAPINTTMQIYTSEKYLSYPFVKFWLRLRNINEIRLVVCGNYEFVTKIRFFL